MKLSEEKKQKYLENIGRWEDELLVFVALNAEKLLEERAARRKKYTEETYKLLRYLQDGGK